MKVVHIGDRLVGEGEPCFVVAESGINHNGDVNLALQLVDAAADAGADAVKFQNYRTEDFLSDRSLTYEYVSQGKAVVEPQYDMFKRYELPPAAMIELREHCDSRRLVFFGTPTSEGGIADLVNLGVPLLKNGSDFLQNLPLIRAMAHTGLPTVISTGMATLTEIEDAVRAFHDAAGKDLILLACTSLYPTPPEDVNLRRIPKLASIFHCPAGLSDHTQGIVAAIGAVALGACMIEKHFTLRKNLPGPDHRFSADPKEFRSMVEAVRTLERSLGKANIGPTLSEMKGRRDFRLSCASARDLAAGHALSESDVIFQKPGTGLPPGAKGSLLGRRLARPVPSGHLFIAEDFV